MAIHPKIKWIIKLKHLQKANKYGLKVTLTFDPVIEFRYGNHSILKLTNARAYGFERTFLYIFMGVTYW